MLDPHELCSSPTAPRDDGPPRRQFRLPAGWRSRLDSQASTRTRGARREAGERDGRASRSRPAPGPCGSRPDHRPERHRRAPGGRSASRSPRLPPDLLHRWEGIPLSDYKWLYEKGTPPESVLIHINEYAGDIATSRYNLSVRWKTPATTALSRFSLLHMAALEAFAPKPSTTTRRDWRYR